MKFSDQFSAQEVLTGKYPVSPALEGGVKGHNIKGKYLTGKPFGILRAVSSAERPRPLGRGASLSASV